MQDKEDRRDSDTQVVQRMSFWRLQTLVYAELCKGGQNRSNRRSLWLCHVNVRDDSCKFRDCSCPDCIWLLSMPGEVQMKAVIVCDNEGNFSPEKRWKQNEEMNHQQMTVELKTKYDCFYARVYFLFFSWQESVYSMLINNWRSVLLHFYTDAHSDNSVESRREGSWSINFPRIFFPTSVPVCSQLKIYFFCNRDSGGYCWSRSESQSKDEKLSMIFSLFISITSDE